MATAAPESQVEKPESKPEPPQHNQQDGGPSGPNQHAGPSHFPFPGFCPRNGRGGPMRFGGGRRLQGPPFPQQNWDGNFNRRWSEGPPGPPGLNPNDQGNQFMRNPNDKTNEKLNAIGGPTYNLPPLDIAERKFSGKSRLYIGNIGNEISKDDLTRLFSPYGETSELFLNNEKSFAFIRMDYRTHAEKAKTELDGALYKGRNLKIRFAPNGSTIKVKNLPMHVSNELLYHAFQIFGEIERALVLVDERGKPTGEGIVEFIRKGCAINAVCKCSDNCYFITAALRPCIVEHYEPVDDFDGFPEKYISKKNPDYIKTREIGPRFANFDSFEYVYGERWKQMYQLFAHREIALKKEFEIAKGKLAAEIHFVEFEKKTQEIREELCARDLNRDRQKHQWETKKRLDEEQRQRREPLMRRQQDDLQAPIVHQDEGMHRHQEENHQFMQARQHDDIEQEEAAYEPPQPLFNNMPTGHVNFPMIPRIRSRNPNPSG